MLLVTGGAGFIGANFIRLWLRRQGGELVNVDKLTYAGNLENLADIQADPKYHFHRADICDREKITAIWRDYRVDAVVHFAAETHVDRSVLSSSLFVQTNVVGTQTLLDVARECGCKRFVNVSTDEVYGSLGPTGRFTEATPLAPNSPYSASKAAADLLARSYFETHRFPVITTRCSNNYGPYQFPEKLIPLAITNALEDKQVPVYGDGLNVRDWIAVEDHCEGVALALDRGREGEVYNFGGSAEKPNLEIVRTLLGILGKSEELIRFVKDRPGHDRRYAMDFSKAERELGWRPGHSFDEALKSTVHWYLEHQDWWRRVKSGAYLDYYETQYGGGSHASSR